ncbi:MAG: PQQ-binding-like beta-propeller repeat protein [Frankia sp.]|nr:PQQ-binding-like beta-propeller repeat protein [Frankia sp.]
MPAALLLAAMAVASCSGEPAGHSGPVASTSGGPAAATRPADGPAYAPGWSAVHADAANSDYSPTPGADDVALAWQRGFDGPVRIGPLEWTINVGPTISPAGAVYLSSTVPGCHLQALDLRTGETLWCAEAVAQAAVVSSALIDRAGVAYLADGQAMRAFGADGTVLWETSIVGAPLSAQFTSAGHVLFVTHVGVVYVLDRSSGQPVTAPLELVPDPSWQPEQGLWACARGTAGCPSANTIAVDPRTDTFYLTFWAPGAPHAGVRAIRLVEDEDGQGLRAVPLWENNSLPGGSASSPALSADGNRLYVTDNVDSMHALNTADGSVAWTFPIGIASGGSLSLSPDGVLMPAGGPLQAIVDRGDHGELLWRDETLLNRGIATQAAGDRAYAVVATPGGGFDLVIADTRSGEVLDREPFPGAAGFGVGTTVASDGTILVPTVSGELAAYRPVR